MWTALPPERESLGKSLRAWRSGLGFERKLAPPAAIKLLGGVSSRSERPSQSLSSRKNRRGLYTRSFRPKPSPERPPCGGNCRTTPRSGSEIALGLTPTSFLKPAARPIAPPTDGPLDRSDAPTAPNRESDRPIDTRFDRIPHTNSPTVQRTVRLTGRPSDRPIRWSALPRPFCGKRSVQTCMHEAFSSTAPPPSSSADARRFPPAAPMAGELAASVRLGERVMRSRGSSRAADAAHRRKYKKQAQIALVADDGLGIESAKSTACAAAA